MLNKLKRIYRIFFPIKERSLWHGDFGSWEEAQEHCDGYDELIILERCKESLLKVRNGEAVYERDSVVFDEIQYSWPLLAGLLKAANDHQGRLSVLDFGGSLGSSYYQNRLFIGSLNQVSWSIVEQQHFVDVGKKYFQNERLKFYDDIEICLSNESCNILLLSSVLQYLEDPYEWIKKFTATRIPLIILDLMPFSNDQRDQLTIQEVPSTIYNASYPCWLLNYDKVIAHFEGYEVLATFRTGIKINVDRYGQLEYEGMILSLRAN